MFYKEESTTKLFHGKKEYVQRKYAKKLLKEMASKLCDDNNQKD